MLTYLRFVVGLGVVSCCLLRCFTGLAVVILFCFLFDSLVLFD